MIFFDYLVASVVMKVSGRVPSFINFILLQFFQFILS